jgi:hypothetical protein
MERAVVNMPITPDDLEDGIKILENIIKHPEKYPVSNPISLLFGSTLLKCFIRTGPI